MPFYLAFSHPSGTFLTLRTAFQPCPANPIVPDLAAERHRYFEPLFFARLVTRYWAAPTGGVLGCHWRSFSPFECSCLQRNVTVTNLRCFWTYKGLLFGLGAGICSKMPPKIYKWRNWSRHRGAPERVVLISPIERNTRRAVPAEN